MLEAAPVLMAVTVLAELQRREETDPRVSKYCLFTAKGVLYSAPSQLIGHRLKVRLYRAHLEAWLSGVKVFECEPVRGSVAQRHPKRIDWRHMLPSLKRKPGAFAPWVLRDAMFPRSEYARIWEHLEHATDGTPSLPADGELTSKMPTTTLPPVPIPGKGQASW